MSCTITIKHEDMLKWISGELWKAHAALNDGRFGDKSTAKFRIENALGALHLLGDASHGQS